jgi:hypothetical protein
MPTTAAAAFGQYITPTTIGINTLANGSVTPNATGGYLNTAGKTISLDASWAGIPNLSSTVNGIVVDGSSGGGVDVTCWQPHTAGLAAFLQMWAVPYWTLSDIQAGGTYYIGGAPQTTPTPVPFWFTVNRPIPVTSAGVHTLANGVPFTSIPTLANWNTTLAGTTVGTAITAYDTEMTSRVLPLVAHGDFATTHTAYVTEQYMMPYDHYWHTLRLVITPVTAGVTTAGATTDMFGNADTWSGYKAQFMINNVQTGGSTFGVNGSYTGSTFVKVAEGSLTTSEYNAMNSFAYQQSPDRAGAGNATYWLCAYDTGRNWQIHDRHMYSDGNDNVIATRWDNVVINGSSLEHFDQNSQYYNSYASPYNKWMSDFRSRPADAIWIETGFTANAWLIAC